MADRLLASRNRDNRNNARVLLSHKKTKNKTKQPYLCHLPKPNSPLSLSGCSQIYRYSQALWLFTNGSGILVPCKQFNPRQTINLPLMLA